MRYPVTTALSLAAVLWLTPTLPAVAGQRGHGGPPPSVHANHPTPPAARGGANHAPKAPKAPKGPTAPTSTTSTSTSPVVSRIERNPQLTSRLTALLPSGMSLAQAAQGFKNQGQFIAALHVSHNLGIPFEQLKTEMTGPNHRSLGDAIKTLNPAADAGKDAKTAETEAKDDVKATKSQ